MTEESPVTTEPCQLNRRDSSWAEWVSNPVSGLISSRIGDTSKTEGTLNNESRASPSSWLSNFTRQLPSLPFLRHDEPVEVDDLTDYTKLSSKQIQLLELEAQQGIVKKQDTWCWFEDTTKLPSEKLTEGRPGELSVFNTGSTVCPLPLTRYPISKSDSPRFYIENSLLLPGTHAPELFHERSIFNKAISAFKHYYNFPCEQHAYLRKNLTFSRAADKKVVIISLIGSLPDKYRRVTIGKSCSARHLSLQISNCLSDYSPSQTLAFSLEVPLDQKPLEVCLEECKQLLVNWRHHLMGTEMIFFAGIYHSAPLVLLIAQHMLKHPSDFGISGSPQVGLLNIESCLGGYQFWDHSSDSSNHPGSSNNQANREKALFQGCTRLQQDILGQLTQYCDIKSPKSREVQEALDWIFCHHPHSKLVLISKLYDNFMTISQKLAIEYQHPNIIRHVWCAGEDLGLELKKSACFLSAEDEMDSETSSFQRLLSVPEDRLFEVCFMRNLMTAINLGYTELAFLAKLISPFFISRSFNKHTVPATVKKQQQYELKAWLQEMDAKWKSYIPVKGSTVPLGIHGALEYIEYVVYKANRQAPEHFIIKSGMLEDNQVYDSFVSGVIQTTNLLAPQPLRILYDSEPASSILKSQNQYDLVWQLHGFLSYYSKLRNLPQQPAVKFKFTLTEQPFTRFSFDVVSGQFQRNNKEALRRIREMWELYHGWKPPTRGLKQLHRILSFLSLYSSGAHLQWDMSRTRC